MYIAVTLILFIITAVLLILSENKKVNKEDRRVMVRLVFFSAVFSAISVIGFPFLLKAVNAFLSVQEIRNFLYSIAPAQNTAASFYFIVTLLTNILFLIIYNIGLRIVDRTWIKRVLGKEAQEAVGFEEDDGEQNFFEKISSRFYDGNKLNSEGENVGAWSKTMKGFFTLMIVAEFVLLLVLISLKITIVPESTVSLLSRNLFMIPMAAYVIMVQADVFLKSDKKKSGGKDGGEVGADEIGEEVIGDYQPLIKLYEDVFGGKALISYYRNDGDVAEKSLYGGLTQAQLGKAEEPELLKAVYSNIRKCVKYESPKYLDSVVDLVNGKNVAVVDSICGDYSHYYLSYLQHRLFLGKKAIVICDDKLQVEDILRKYRATFTLINMVTEMWKMGDIDYILQEKGEIDILVCTDDELLTYDLKSRYPKFFDAVSNISIISPYVFISRDKSYHNRLYNYIGEGDVQYVFYISENNTDVKNVLEETVKNDISVYENHSEKTNTCIMYWRGESGLKTQLSLLRALENDFGVAYTIALVAGKFDVNDINIQASSNVPVYSHKSTVVGEYSHTLGREFYKNETVNIEGMVKINNSQIYSTDKMVFNIIYDENNNLITLTNMWLSYGGEACSMIHVISRPYLLREYFAHNLTMLCGETAAVKMFVPFRLLNIRSAALAFLIKTRRGVSVEDIIDFAHVNFMEQGSAESILSALLEIVFGKRNGYRVYESFSFDMFTKPVFENEEYVYTHRVVMTNQNLYKKLCDMTTDNAVVMDASGKTVVAVLPVNKRDIYNHYLPNQTHSFNGIRYKVNTVSKGEIYVRKEETVKFEKEYTPVYSITGVENMTEINTRTYEDCENYCVRFFEGDVFRKTDGYFEFTEGINFGNDVNMSRKTFTPAIEEKKHASFMRITFDYAFNENYEKIASLMVVLLRGVLETLLPKNYKDLLVFSKIDKNVLCKEEIEGADAEVSLSEEDKLLYLHPDVRADCLSGNSENQINIYIVDYSVSESGALTAIAEDVDRILSIIKRYMGWVLSCDGGKGSYLCFGLDNIPVMFAAKELADWIDNIAIKEKVPDKVIDGKYKIATSLCCDFCGKPVLGTGMRLGDGRVMCRNCAEHRTNTKHEVKVLLKRAYSLIENKYGVKLPSGIKIKFARREEVEKDAGPNVLGYYMPSKNLIKIQRGGPEANVLSTLIHELTHAWQWKVGGVGNLPTMYKEGHSMYVEVECMKDTEHTEFAKRLEEITALRDDEYGEGFRYWSAYLKEQPDKNIFKHISEMKV